MENGSYRPPHDHPSPTKKRKLDSHPPSLDGDPAAYGASSAPMTAQETVQLSNVPAPVALFALATSLRASAASLLPHLSKRPSSSSTSSQARYTATWSAYVHYATSAIVLLRAAARLTAGASEWTGGRVELRANAMLAETLVDTYEGSGNENGVALEAEKAITRALAISESHPSLKRFTLPLTLLHLRLALLTGKPSRYIRTNIRRLLSTVTPLSPTAPDPTAAAHYALESFITHLPTTGTDAVASTTTTATWKEKGQAWQSVQELASQRGDDSIRVLALLAEAQLLLIHSPSDYSRAGSILSSLFSVLGIDPDPEPGKWPRVVKVLYRLMYCLWKSQMGEAKEAKEVLKSTHKLLDAQVEREEIESDKVQIAFTHANDPSAGSMAFRVPPHPSLYTFAFLASAAIHLDPLGKSPRSALFAEEGVRIVESKLGARDATQPVTSLAFASQNLTAVASLKVHFHLLLASLSTMRSSYTAAETHLSSALSTLRAWYPSTWTSSEAALKIVFEWAQVRIAHAAKAGVDENEAEEALEAVIFACEKRRKESKEGGIVEHLRNVAMLSLLLLRLSNPTLSMPMTTPTDTLVRTLTASEPSSTSSAHSRLIHSLAQALTVPSITASKAALSAALALANQMQANHVRVGVLALLANVFLWTREGEAQKMLISALKLAQSMGSAVDRSYTFLDAPGSPSVVIGNARLGLWLGERLLESYRSDSLLQKTDEGRQKLVAQERVNEACRRMLERDEAAVAEERVAKMET
ncbi:hypothetical protein JCM10295v2_001997 [Rhodotorula toruloides]